MGKARLEIMLTNLLNEFASVFGIAYAILYRPSKEGAPMLVIRFYSDRPDERFRLRLDFVTLLPFIPIDVQDYHMLSRELLRHIFRYGKVIYVGSYETYLQDLKHVAQVT